MQADIPPQLFIQITGTHTETRYETITETRNGQTSTRTETKQYTVTDFDFSVDCNEVVPWDSPKRMFVVPDGELCYRGGSLKEFGGKDWRYDLHLDAGYGDIEGGGRSTFGSKRDKRLDRRRSNWGDRSRAEKAKAKVKARGLPPFVRKLSSTRSIQRLGMIESLPDCDGQLHGKCTSNSPPRS